MWSPLERIKLLRPFSLSTYCRVKKASLKTRLFGNIFWSKRCFNLLTPWLRHYLYMETHCDFVLIAKHADVLTITNLTNNHPGLEKFVHLCCIVLSWININSQPVA